MRQMSPKPSSPVPAPFLFQGHSALLAELEADELFRSRPATEQEAREIGYLYPKVFDPKDPFGSVEKALCNYTGLTDRHILFVAQRRGIAKRFHVLQDSNGYKVLLDPQGLLSYFLSQVERFLSKKGVPTSVIDCSDGFDPATAFLAGSAAVRTPALPA